MAFWGNIEDVLLYDWEVDLLMHASLHALKDFLPAALLSTRKTISFHIWP